MGNLKHGLQEELFLEKQSRGTVEPKSWTPVLKCTGSASGTMMERSPRAPVFLSRAILAMALKAALFMLSSHWKREQHNLMVCPDGGGGGTLA